MCTFLINVALFCKYVVHFRKCLPFSRNVPHMLHHYTCALSCCQNCLICMWNDQLYVINVAHFVLLFRNVHQLLYYLKKTVKNVQQMCHYYTCKNVWHLWYIWLFVVWPGYSGNWVHLKMADHFGAHLNPIWVSYFDKWVAIINYCIWR
jgi:hypothetical protein